MKRIAKFTLLIVLMGLSAANHAYAYTYSPTIEDTSKINKKIKASFPGGDKELYKYIGENLKYPEKSRSNYIEGRVIVEFTVSKEGDLINPEIILGLDQFCDKEVLRIVSEMPKWIPATRNGTAIESKIKLPVSFKSQHILKKEDFFLDSKAISEKEFNLLNPHKIKSLIIQREEFATKNNVYTFKMLKVGNLEVQNISQDDDQVTFDILTLPEDGVIKAEIIDGNGHNLDTKMILNPINRNSVKLTFDDKAKKPIFIGINQLGTTLNINLTK